jgi:FMN reductase
MSLLAVNASISPAGRTHRLARAAVRAAGTALPGEPEGLVIDLASIDAGALLGRSLDPALDEAVAAATEASVLVLVTPIYRATFTSLLKAFVERLPRDALAGTAVILAASSSGPSHFLSLDTGLRALVASVKGWTVPSVAYGSPDQFDEDGEPRPALIASLAVALAEASRLTGALAPLPSLSTSA